MTRRVNFIDGLLSRQVCRALEGPDVLSPVTGILVSELMANASISTFSLRLKSRLLKAVLTAQLRGVAFPALDVELNVHGWDRMRMVLVRLSGADMAWTGEEEGEEEEDEEEDLRRAWVANVELLEVLGKFVLRRKGSPIHRRHASEVVMALARCHPTPGTPDAPAARPQHPVLDRLVRLAAVLYASVQPSLCRDTFAALLGMVKSSRRGRMNASVYGPRRGRLEAGAILVSADGEADVILHVDRSDLVASSLHAMTRYTDEDWDRCETIDVRFAAESGVGEGVVRDWLGELCTQVFYRSGFFAGCDGDPAVVHPNIQLPDDAQTCDMMDFAGRVMGLARRLSMPTGVHLSDAAIAMITGRALDTSHLRQTDATLAASCAAVRSMGGPGGQEDDVDLGAFVSPGLDCELFPGGRLVTVGRIEREAFADLLAARHLLGRCVDAGLWIRRGLRHVLPCEQCLETDRMSAPAFNAAFGGRGRHDLDVAEWRGHTDVCAVSYRIKGGDERRIAAMADMVFEVVEGMDAADRRRMLRFWTGSSSLPQGGFRSLSGRLSLIVEPTAEKGRLPSSHTCVLTLVVPVHASATVSEMRSALRTCLVSMDIFDDSQ